MPAHDRQMKVPNLGEAHCGEGAEQSTQTLFPGSFWIERSYKRVSSMKQCSFKVSISVDERGIS